MSKPHSEKPSGECMPTVLQEQQGSNMAGWRELGGEWVWGGVRARARWKSEERLEKQSEPGTSLASHFKNRSIYTTRDGKLLKRFEKWMDRNMFLKELPCKERKKRVPL